MGIGKAFVSSRKFLRADGGIGRITWMPTELKQMIRRAFEGRVEEEGLTGLLDQIVDETQATSPHEVRALLEQNGHPALSMPEMATLWAEEPESSSKPVPVPDPVALKAAPTLVETTPEPESIDRGAIISDLKSELKTQIESELRNEISREIVGDIIGALKERLLGEQPAPTVSTGAPTPTPRPAPEPVAEPRPVTVQERTREPEPTPPVAAPPPTPTRAAPGPYAREKIEAVTRFPIPRDRPGETIETVPLGSTIADGGTRQRTLTLGGQDCLPFHFYEGKIPNKPAYALEVFDAVSDRTSPVLREVWGDLLERPVEMAVKCVRDYAADAISVRLASTHPQRGGTSPDQALALVKDVLAAVEVPVIVTAHNHFESANEVFKKIGAGCQGERLLLNWVEGDNYRTIAGVALAYGHCVVAQSPIDVNLAKQLNILLTNMDLRRDQIVMDPMTGALGYCLEYTYSVMERIRSTALGGDTALALPMIVTVGQESWKVKEAHATVADFPAWGERSRRALMWEIQTAMPLILAGADLLVLYHPESLAALRRNVDRLSLVDRPETGPASSGGPR